MLILSHINTRNLHCIWLILLLTSYCCSEVLAYASSPRVHCIIHRNIAVYRQHRGCPSLQAFTEPASCTRQYKLSLRMKPDDEDGEKLSSLESFGKVVDNVGSSAKTLVIILASSIVLFSPSSWLPVYYCSMSLLCSSISKSIKNTLRWPRPEGSPEVGYGMPSSHAQAFFFWFSAISLKLLVYTDKIHPLSYILCPMVGTYSVMAR
jgi:hypothetical protein